MRPVAGRTWGREHRPVTENIFDLAKQVIRGQIRLPKFQRGFVWSREQVLDLLDSIARDYPIGSFLIWDSGDIQLASEDTIAGLPVAKQEDGQVVGYLIDGRQRLSTIAGALYWNAQGDPASDWNLVYDLEQERFLHRTDFGDPPAHEFPLRALPDTSAFVNRFMLVPEPLRDRATALLGRFQKYEISVVTLQDTHLPEIGRIFQRVNTRGTPLTMVELVRAATWTQDFDLLDQLDRVRDALAAKHYGLIEHRLLLRAVSAAAGHGFSTNAMERLADTDLSELRAAVTATEGAARHAVDFLTTEIGTPTADALPYPNQLAAIIEIFRQVPRPTSQQYAEIRRWFWSTVLSGYFEAWNTQKMAVDFEAIRNFASGGNRIEVTVADPSSGLWLDGQYNRSSARTKAFALMLAIAGPRDLRTGNRIDAGKALASANAMEFHHFFPKNYLARRGTPYQAANVLANIVMLTSSSNGIALNRAPSDYLREFLANCTSQAEFTARAESLLIPPPALEAARADQYERFLEARVERLLEWSTSLARGVETPRVDPSLPVTSEPMTEIIDTDTED